MVAALRRPVLAAVLAALVLSLPAPGQPAAASGPDSLHVTHVEQPTGIAPAMYANAWPSLAPLLGRISHGDRAAVVAELRQQASSESPSDGALNLLAQVEREDGRLEESEKLIARAIAMKPEQHLHHFQQAMTFHARLSKAKGLSRWKWHRKTRGAYQRAFELDPKPVPYRYYLVYSYLQTPGIAGGNKDRALRMTQEAIDAGQKEFFVVRADVHRFRGEPEAAFGDYDRAISERTFKLNSFLAAGHLALERNDRPRAKAYFEWAARCRPTHAAARIELEKLRASAVRDSG